MFLVLQREVNATFLTELLTFNTLHKLQRFALVELRPTRSRPSSALELYEIPVNNPTLDASVLSSSPITVYTTVNDTREKVYTTLDEMVMDENNFPEHGPDFLNDSGRYNMTPPVWRTPLAVVDGAFMDRYRGRCDLVNQMSGFNTVGTLETAWSMRRGSTPPPYASQDSRRRSTQAAYLNQHAVSRNLSSPVQLQSYQFGNSGQLETISSDSDEDMEISQSFETAWPTACEVRQAQLLNERSTPRPSPLAAQPQPPSQPPLPVLTTEPTPSHLVLTPMVADQYREYLAAVQRIREITDAPDSPPLAPNLLPLPPSPASPEEEQRHGDQESERERIRQERRERNSRQAWDRLDRLAGKNGARRKR